MRALAAILLVASTARAQDAFEIQVYDAETAPPAAFGVELHLNAVAAPSALAVFHATLEPHLGVARWAEVGVYLQTATAPGGPIDFAGFKARVKLRWPRRLGGVVGLAANAELSIVPARYEADVWGSELRPIADLRWRRLYLSVNPIIAFALAGDAAGVPRFEPAAKASVSAAPWLALGAEYYGAFGDGGAQRLFAVADLARSLGDGAELTLNLGGGYDFVGPDKWIVKAIVGIGR